MTHRDTAVNAHTFGAYANGNQMDAIQYKSTAGKIEVKAESEDGRLHIRAYACAFNNVDSYGDAIAPTACDTWLASDEAGRVALCYQHDMSDVIGVVTDKGVDTYGLWFEADILPTTSGRDVQILMRAGAIREFSIGYYPVNAHYDVRDEKEIRVLDEIRIAEISPVTRAANPRAVLVDMKSERGMLQIMGDDELMELKGAVEAEIAMRVLDRV